jgi:DNA-binding transcriptional MerR regulator
VAGGASAAAGAGLTIARAARAVGLSRTTLMYYERLGLIRPLRRAGSRYRTFRAEDLQALFLISRWRAAGLPLDTVRRLLADPDEAAGALRDHLRSLDRAIESLRAQRRLAQRLLGRGPRADGGAMPLTKAGWSALFRAIGMSEQQMRRWHAEFERENSAGHRQFLRSLGLGAAEIGRIRRWCTRQPSSRRGHGH